MALPALLGSLSLSTRLDLTTVGAAMAIPLTGTKRLALTINGLTGSGATLAIDGSRDGGATWVSTGLQVTDYDLGTSLTALVDDGDYRLVTRGYTHVQVRVGTAGSGVASVTPMPVSRAQEVLQLPAGTNFLGYFGLSRAMNFAEPFNGALPAAVNNAPPAWVKVATTTSATRLLRVDFTAAQIAASVFDVEWSWTITGGAATTMAASAAAVIAGETFNEGFPIGDIYMRSASGQNVIVKTGA